MALNVKDLSTFQGVVAIIPAAGSGQRMQSSVPKQYLKIKHETILDITLAKILEFEPVNLVILVISPEDHYYHQLQQVENHQVIIVEGGSERAQSVFNALQFLYDSGLPDDIGIMVHDAARPCITKSDLKRLYEYHLTDNSACLLSAPVVDTLQEVSSEGKVHRTADRDHLVRALTPQMASFIQLKFAIKNAMDNRLPITDETSALLHAGYSVKAITGRSDNIKITHPQDIALATFFLEKQKSEVSC